MGPTALNVGPDCFHRGKHCALCLPQFNIALPGFARRISAQSSHTISQTSLLGRRPAVRRKPLNTTTTTTTTTKTTTSSTKMRQKDVLQAAVWKAHHTVLCTCAHAPSTWTTPTLTLLYILQPLWHRRCAKLYNTTQCNATHYSTIESHTYPDIRVQYRILHCLTWPCITLLSLTFPCITLHYKALYTLHCIALHTYIHISKTKVDQNATSRNHQKYWLDTASIAARSKISKPQWLSSTTETLSISEHLWVLRQLPTLNKRHAKLETLLKGSVQLSFPRFAEQFAWARGAYRFQLLELVPPSDRPQG